MKYLEKFKIVTDEDLKRPFKFKIGDYVKFDEDDDYAITAIRKFGDRCYEIIDTFYEKEIYNNNYKLKSLDDDLLEFWEYESALRSLTSKELKDLKYKMTVRKYNL